MRSPVARLGVAASAALVLLLLVGTGVADAAGARSAASLAVESRFSGGTLAGPVGVIAVVLGVGGIVVGLVRRRRAALARAAASAAPAETAPADQPAVADTGSAAAAVVEAVASVTSATALRATGPAIDLSGAPTT